MPGQAVIIFSFPEPGPNDSLTFPLLVEKAKPIFKDVEKVRIHAGIKEAADEVIAIFDEKMLPDGELTDIGPECFTNGEVISYKGQNYYKACDAFVSDKEDGGKSYCVKRVGHPGYLHEDYDGKTRGE